eukprot:9369115-Lingulodinium_polyedra.AAC.1
MCSPLLVLTLRDEQNIPCSNGMFCCTRYVAAQPEHGSTAPAMLLLFPSNCGGCQQRAELRAAHCRFSPG